MTLVSNVCPHSLFHILLSFPCPWFSVHVPFIFLGNRRLAPSCPFHRHLVHVFVIMSIIISSKSSSFCPFAYYFVHALIFFSVCLLFRPCPHHFARVLITLSFLIFHLFTISSSLLCPFAYCFVHVLITLPLSLLFRPCPLHLARVLIKMSMPPPFCLCPHLVVDII